MRRRSFLRAAGAGAATVGLAGCLGDTGLGGGGGGIPETIKIGVLAPAPENNPIGASIANGADLAATQINDAGGVGEDGAQVEVIVEDTQEDPGTGRARYQDLTLSEEVHMTTGVFTSEVLLNLMDDIAETGTLHITSGAATPEASALVAEDYERYKYHFRINPVNAVHLGEHMVAFARDNFENIGWESVAVLVEDYKWTEPVQEVLDTELADVADVVMSERYASGTENFTPIFDEVEASGADAAFIAMAHTGTPAVIQWARQQRPFAFGGIHVPMQLPQYYGLVEGACNYGITFNTATPTSAITDKTIPFSDAFNEAYGSYPVYTGYGTFDAINQYVRLVEQEGTVGADAMVTALEGDSYTGTAGTIEYYGPDEEFAHDIVYTQENIWPPYQQWQDGTQEVIWPNEFKTADYQPAPWL